MSEYARLVLAVDSTSAKRATDDLRTLGAQSKQTEGAAQSMTKSFASLRNVLGGIGTGVGMKALIDTADTWGQYASRIRMATQSAQEYDYVQGRMAASAQETFRSINETREAFINMSPVIRDMGFSLEQSIDAVDAFSGLLVVNGANAERGAAAMSALSKSLQKGKVDADAWMTVYSTADTIVQSLALSTGKSEEEIRQLGISGKLTGKQLVDALTGDYERIMQQVAEMPTTVRDALQNLNTAFTEYVGWQNEAAGITAKLADGIVVLGDHFDTLANVAMVGMAAAAGRVAGVMAISTTEMYRSAAASIAKRAASIAATQAQVEQATATARSTAAEVAAARAQVAFAAGTNAQVAALSRLRLARLADYEATQAQIAAQAALSRAQSLSRGLLGVLGGPTGLAITAAATAASFLAFRDSAQQLRQPLIDLKRPAEDINDELGKMSKLRLDSSIADAVGQQKQALDEMRASLADVSRTALLPDKWGQDFDSSIDQRMRAWKEFERQIKAGIDISAATNDLISAIKPSDDLRQSILNSALAYEEQREKAGAAGDVIQMARDAMAALTVETDINTASTGANSAAKEGMSEAGGKFLKSLQDQLGALQDNGSMVKQVERYLRDHADATDTDAVALRSAAAAIDSQREASRKAARENEGLTKGVDQLTSSYESTAAGLQQQIALYGQTTEVARLRYEMESGSLQGLASKQVDYLQGLAKELDAKRDLTEQEQLRITLLRETGQLRAANDAQFQLEYAAKIAEYERQIVEYEKEGNAQGAARSSEAKNRLETLRRIREVQMSADQAPGTVEGVSKAPKSSIISPEIGGPSSEMTRLAQEAIALEQWRTTELEKQRAFYEAKAITKEAFEERERNITQQHHDQLAQIEASRRQVQLAAGEVFFGSMTSITKQFAGEQTGLYRAMFAIQKAAAIAQSIIAIQQGIAMAAANPWPLNLGAMASVAAATAGLVNNIASVGLAGMAHDGIDSIPREGTWLLDKGERVVDRRTNADLKDYLAQGGGNGGRSQQQAVHQTFEINGDVSQETVELVRNAMKQTMLAVQQDANQNGPIMQTIRRRM